MKRLSTIIASCLLALLLPVCAFAAEMAGFSVTLSDASVAAGNTVTVTVSLDGYTTAADPIRGLQVDVTGIDTAYVEVVDAETKSLITQEARHNVAAERSEDKSVRLTYVSKDEETIPVTVKDLLQVTLKVNPELTGSGRIPLTVTTLLQTETGPVTLPEQSIEIAYTESVTVPDAVAAVKTAEGVCTEYTALADALDAAQAGDTVMLLNDTEFSLLPVLGDITFDLNGYKITAKYVTCFGNIIDSSEANSGILNVQPTRLLIQESNTQIPVATASGYQFIELIGFNTAVIQDNLKFVFQPRFESAGNALLTQLEDLGDIAIYAQLAWTNEIGELRLQNFSYNQKQISTYLNSYVPETGKYGKLLSLTLKNLPGHTTLSFHAVVSSDCGVEHISQ